MEPASRAVDDRSLTATFGDVSCRQCQRADREAAFCGYCGQPLAADTAHAPRHAEAIEDEGFDSDELAALGSGRTRRMAAAALGVTALALLVTLAIVHRRPAEVAAGASSAPVRAPAAQLAAAPSPLPASPSVRRAGKGAKAGRVHAANPVRQSAVPPQDAPRVVARRAAAEPAQSAQDDGETEGAEDDSEESGAEANESTAAALGLDTSAYLQSMQRVIASHNADVIDCYEKAFAGAPSRPNGRVEISFIVQLNGYSSLAGVTSNSTGNAQLGACVAQRFRQWQFPLPPRGDFAATYPFVFDAS